VTHCAAESKEAPSTLNGLQNRQRGGASAQVEPWTPGNTHLALARSLLRRER